MMLSFFSDQVWLGIRHHGVRRGGWWVVGGGRRTREGSLPVCAVKSQPSDGDAAVPCFSFHPHPLGLQREGGRVSSHCPGPTHPALSLSPSHQPRCRYFMLKVSGMYMWSPLRPVRWLS